MTADEIKALLKLAPHPKEGGFFRRTYTSAGTVELPRGLRAQGTAIYYLLEAGTFSEMHVLDSDEIFHFYLGDPIRMMQLDPDGNGRTIMLGPDVLHGQQLQVVVPRGVWQGSCLEPCGTFALLGCTVAPGFEYADYESGDRQSLQAQYPAFAEAIRRLTPG